MVIKFWLKIFAKYFQKSEKRQIGCKLKFLLSFVFFLPVCMKSSVFIYSVLFVLFLSVFLKKDEPTETTTEHSCYCCYFLNFSYFSHSFSLPFRHSHNINSNIPPLLVAFLHVPSVNFLKSCCRFWFLWWQLRMIMGNNLHMKLRDFRTCPF